MRTRLAQGVVVFVVAFGGADAARAGAWTPAGGFEGQVRGAAMNARGDVAVTTVGWPGQRSTLRFRSAGGAFAAASLPGVLDDRSLGLSDTGEAILLTTEGDASNASTNLVHRAASGEHTVTPLPGLRHIAVALREDGLGLLFARSGDAGTAVVAWKPPGQATFGDLAPLPDFKPVIPSTSYGYSNAPSRAPFHLQAGPALGFTDGVAVVIAQRGDAMEARAAAPFGSFGPPERIGPATERTARPRLRTRGGHAVVTWDSGVFRFEPNTIFTSTKTPGRGFGPAAVVGTGSGITSPPIGIGPDGRVVVSWSAFTPNWKVGQSIATEGAREQVPGASAYSPVLIPAELAAPSTPVQFDSQGALVLSGTSSTVLPSPPGDYARRSPGVWTWSRAADGTVAGPDLVSGSAKSGSFVLNGRGQGVALVSGPRLDPVSVFDYDETATLGRTAPSLWAVRLARDSRGLARTSRSADPVGSVALRLTKTARVRLKFEQTGRAGVVRRRCRGRSKASRKKVCRQRRSVTQWRPGQVGANTLPPTRAVRRFLRRPGRYRVSIRPRDSQRRDGRTFSVRFRIKR